MEKRRRINNEKNRFSSEYDNISAFTDPSNPPGPPKAPFSITLSSLRLFFDHPKKRETIIRDRSKLIRRRWRTKKERERERKKEGEKDNFVDCKRIIFLDGIPGILSRLNRRKTKREVGLRCSRNEQPFGSAYLPFTF